MASTAKANRPRRTRHEWRGEVARWRASGMTAPAYATKQGISKRTLTWWASELGSFGQPKPAARAPAFLPLEVRGVSSSGRSSFDIQIELSNGRSLRVRSDVDAVRLRELVDALEGEGR